MTIKAELLGGTSEFMSSDEPDAKSVGRVISNSNGEEARAYLGPNEIRIDEHRDRNGEIAGYLGVLLVNNVTRIEVTGSLRHATYSLEDSVFTAQLVSGEQAVLSLKNYSGTAEEIRLTQTK